VDFYHHIYAFDLYYLKINDLEETIPIICQGYTRTQEKYLSHYQNMSRTCHQEKAASMQYLSHYQTMSRTYNQGKVASMQYLSHYQNISQTCN
jgi:hypothetical protein